MGGLYLLPLKKIRGERVRVETAFSGFSNSLLHLFLASFVTGMLTMLGFALPDPARHLSLCGVVLHPAAGHRQAARLLARHAVQPQDHHQALVEVPGLPPRPGRCSTWRACWPVGVGVFVTLPVSFAALMYAYEDIFNPPGRLAAGPSRERAPRRQAQRAPGRGYAAAWPGPRG